MEFRTDDVCALVTDIWVAMVGLPVERVSRPPDPDGSRWVSGTVHIDGDHRASVSVGCTEPLARQMAAALFAVPAGELADTDVQDAVGELANMVGGNVKTLLGGSCRLSLPTVVEGADVAVRVPGTSVLNRLAFVCSDHPLVVSLLAPTDVRNAPSLSATGAVPR